MSKRKYITKPEHQRVSNVNNVSIVLTLLYYCGLTRPGINYYRDRALDTLRFRVNAGKPKQLLHKKVCSIFFLILLCVNETSAYQEIPVKSFITCNMNKSKLKISKIIIYTCMYYMQYTNEFEICT